LIVRILVTIVWVILNLYIITPVMYALHPSYAGVLQNQLFGGVIIFLLDNFGFILLIGLVLWIIKGLQQQQTQNINYGVGQ